MKERLLGAAVLVLIAVLVVPMLLDGPDQDTGQVTRDLELPAPQSTPARTHVVELQTPDNGRPEQTQPAMAAPATVSAPPPAAKIDDATVPKTPAPRPTVVADPPTAPQSGWAVQVGSFTSESNARRLQELLRTSDYPVFVTRSVVQGRVMYRVRVGPEPDRTGAEALAERLRADRQTTQIVEHP